MEALGPELSTPYITVKRSEYAAFSAEDLDFEIKHHIHKF
jgi:glutamine synthetase